MTTPVTVKWAPHYAQMHAEHRAKYEALAQAIGVRHLARLIEESIATPGTIRVALLKDTALNNIAMRRWDSAHYGVRQMVFSGKIAPSWAEVDTVCVLKHVALYHMAGATAEEIDALGLAQLQEWARAGDAEYYERTRGRFGHRDPYPSMIYSDPARWYEAQPVQEAK